VRNNICDLIPKYDNENMKNIDQSPATDSEESADVSVHAYYQITNIHTHAAGLGSADDKHAKNMQSKSHDSRITKQKLPH
jgi:hypothetical protein